MWIWGNITVSEGVVSLNIVALKKQSKTKQKIYLGGNIKWLPVLWSKSMQKIQEVIKTYFDG